MYQRPTASKPVGEVLGDTFRLFKASFASCWIPTLVMSVVATAVTYYRFSALPVLPPDAPLQDVLQQLQTTPPGYGVLSLALILLEFLIYGVLFINVVTISNGHTPAFGESLSLALRRLPAFLIATLVFAIALTVGFTLLIIPGFYVWNRLQFYMVPVMTEGQGPVQSLKTSWRLVAGNWWRTAVLVSVITIILCVFVLALLVIGAAIAAVVMSGPGGLAQGTGAIVRTLTLFGGVFAVFTAPLVVAVFVAVYQDLRLRELNASR